MLFWIMFFIFALIAFPCSYMLFAIDKNIFDAKTRIQELEEKPHEHKPFGGGDYWGDEK